jgi:metallo-beta-lactamase class B
MHKLDVLPRVHIMTKRTICATLLLAAMAAMPVLAQDDWSTPVTPFNIYGNSWYVGSHGLSAVLVTSPQGHILIDGTAPANAALIEANIRRLGFRLRDVKVILNSHAHVDHAGAIARLSHDTGAPVYASKAGAVALAAGGRDPADPQYSGKADYTPVHARILPADGHVHVGTLDLTAHATPGHTPGSTSYTWRSCEQGKCVDIVYADSLTAFGNHTYRFTDSAAEPDRVERFRRSIALVDTLPCDILVTTHPDVSDFLERAGPDAQGHHPATLIDGNACHRLAARSTRMLDDKLADEKTLPTR